MTEQAKDPQKEGEETTKVLRTYFKSEGLDDAEIDEKIEEIAEKAAPADGSFWMIRLKDVVYTVEVTGVQQVEIQMMPGGKSNQDDKYRIREMEKTLPNILAILKQMDVSIVYMTMEKPAAQPYMETLEQFGFSLMDIPEETGVKDMVAFIVRLQ